MQKFSALSMSLTRIRIPNYRNNYYDTYSGGGNISYAGESGWAFNGSYKGTGGKSYTNMSFDTEPFGSNSGIAVNNVGRQNM